MFNRKIGVSINSNLIILFSQGMISSVNNSVRIVL